MHPNILLPLGLLLLAPVSLGATDSPTTDDLSSLREAFDAARRQAVATPGGFRLDNRAAGLGVGLDGRGLALLADLGGSSWGLELTAWGREGGMVALAGQAEVRPEGHRVTYAWGGGLDEWVVNHASGLEHGYTLQAAPERAAGQPLWLDLEVRGDLTPRVSSDGTGVAFLDDAGQVDVTYDGLFAFDAAGRELPAHLEPRGTELRLVVDDVHAVYPVTIDPKIQLGYLKAEAIDPTDHFGDAVDVHGDTAVIGVPEEESAATGVYGDAFDNSLTRAGAAYVFVRNGATWTQQAYLKASNTTTQDRFGYDVAVHGDRIAVSAPFERSAATGVGGNQIDSTTHMAGAVYVFYRFGLTWGQEAYVKSTNTENGDRFGFSVDLSDDLLVVGSDYEDGGVPGINGDQSDNSQWRSGAAYVYVRSGFTWSPALYLKASNPESEDRFGAAVAIEGDRIVVGAPGEDSAATGIDGDQSDNSAFGSGAAYVFELKGEVWAQDAYVKASNAESGDNFGRSLDLDADTFVVGATLEESGVAGDPTDNTLPSAGAAYVFHHDGAAWSQQAYLKAEVPGAMFFGISVGISGDRVVVGAPYEDGSNLGIDNEPDGLGMFVGAAYLFERSAGLWTQSSYLKASNPDDHDRFGTAVAIDGSTILVGAPGEDGGMNGPFADQSDNSAAGAGAAYAFDVDSPWGVERYGPETGANVADLFAYTAPLTNSMFTLEMSDWNEPGITFLMVSAAPTSLPLFGGTLLVDPQWSVFGPNGTVWLLAPGTESEYTAYVPPLLAGYTVYAQAMMLDTTQAQGFALTNGLSISAP